MRKKIKYTVTILFILLLPFFAAALPNPEEEGVTLTADDIQDLIEGFASYFAMIVGALGVITMLYSAFLFLTAAGNDEQVKKAKGTFLWGLVGVGVALIAFSIFDLVRSFLE